MSQRVFMASDRPAAAASGTLRSGPFDLGFRIEGAGASALVIGSSVQHPRLFPTRLRDHLRLAFVDQRAFARPTREVTPADFAFDDMLADVERLREHLQLGQVVLIGASGNGLIALEYAKRYPNAVTHVVLIATPPGFGAIHVELAERHWAEAVCPERRARHDVSMQALEAAVAADPDRAFVTYCLHMGARTWFDASYDAAALWSGVHVNMAGFQHVWGEVFRDLDVAEGLERLQMPVLIALGRVDYLIAPNEAWEPHRAHFPDLTIRVFDRSGHAPPLEEPAAFVTTLLDWLARPRADAEEATATRR
ncbi:MAG: alpha/beta hydrolase [Pseudomonadota bacterium]